MKKFRLSDKLYILIVLVIASVMIFRNYKYSTFWNANLIQILTITLTAIISFFFVQRLTDRRRKIDCFEHILTEIQNLINNNDVIFSYDKNATNLQKSVANKIKHLKDHGFKEISADLEYINNEFTELRELYDNHNQSVDSLKAITLDLNRHKINISDKIDKIRLSLYEI